LLSLACQVGAPLVDTEATVAAAIEATQDAQPTATLTPSQTPTETPTLTPSPEPTATPTPTQTPTLTPLPTGAVTSNAALEGWTRYDFLADGFSISLPDSWEQFNTDPETMGAIMDAAGDGNENIASMLSNQLFQTMMVEGIKFIAVEISPESLTSDLPTTMNILMTELPFTVDLETLVTLSIGQLEQAFDFIEPIEHQPLILGPDNISAEKLISKINQTNALGNPIETYLAQVLILDDKIQFVITFATTLDNAELISPSFEEIAKTFEFIDIP
jgi:hypothetical protein